MRRDGVVKVSMYMVTVDSRKGQSNGLRMWMISSAAEEKCKTLGGVLKEC